MTVCAKTLDYMYTTEIGGYAADSAAKRGLKKLQPLGYTLLAAALRLVQCWQLTSAYVQYNIVQTLYQSSDVCNLRTVKRLGTPTLQQRNLLQACCCFCVQISHRVHYLVYSKDLLAV